jgi:hypothetical protein
LARFAAKATRAAFDPASNAWTLETDKARASVQLAGNQGNSGPALCGLSMTAPGALVELLDLRLAQ